jgi:hypothetical protein
VYDSRSDSTVGGRSGWRYRDRSLSREALILARKRSSAAVPAAMLGTLGSVLLKGTLRHLENVCRWVRNWPAGR